MPLTDLHVGSEGNSDLYVAMSYEFLKAFLETEDTQSTSSSSIVLRGIWLQCLQNTAVIW